ncbi:MAG: DEAD/DEAH box helicase [Pirellulales bacterium]
MSNFERLHPALQHHIVNSLGWRELRPFQDEVIPPILDGKHLIVLAPTAGGKTEAAFFPVVSRMLTEGWTGLSLLYLCPIKALLNNLDQRLQRYCSLLGRRSGLWHGDVKASARKRILREPPDCLLTTPESLEVMLVSPSIDARRLFSQLQVVIVDEIHAFAGDDRGWHLLSVLERITRLAGRELQRLGLSATVGNPLALAEWLAGSCSGPREVFLPPASAGPGPAEVQLDYVGSLKNAAVVTARLHRGEKRLVFVDSRARAEELATELRQLGVTTFVTHSSLSQEQRHQAEEAFASREDCVIVATSVLELGIDVGNLDRVIQIDSPPTVSSFLQRMGRTGRRAGTVRNCLFLATKDPLLIQAAGLIQLWESGFVEPIEPPPMPLHVLAQQLMALCLQEGGIGRSEWFGWVERMPGFRAIDPEYREQLVAWMLERDILWEEAGILAVGRGGEEEYGRRHFLELLSVFTSPPMFTVLQGRRELGFVDQMTFLSKQEGPRVLLLGGRAWKVNHIDWQRRMAYVEPTDSTGRSRWMGKGRGLGYELSQSIRTILAGDEVSDRWSHRAVERITEIRHEYSWVDCDSTVVLDGRAGGTEWWTFGGARANATLAQVLAELLNVEVDHDSFMVNLEGDIKLQDLIDLMAPVSQRDIDAMLPAVDEQAIDGLKFSECLPRGLALEMLQRRLQDPAATRRVLAEPVRFVVDTDNSSTGD